MTGTQEWRLKMDMFMDKLSQKLTAQEIIKANTAADTEELNKLKGQVKDYSACLDRLEQLIEEISEKLSGTRSVDGESINRIQAVLEDRLDTMAKALTAQMEIFDKNNNTVMQQEAAQKDFFAQQQEVLAGLKALTEVHQAAVQKMIANGKGATPILGGANPLQTWYNVAVKVDGSKATQYDSVFEGYLYTVIDGYENGNNESKDNMKSMLKAMIKDGYPNLTVK